MEYSKLKNSRSPQLDALRRAWQGALEERENSPLIKSPAFIEALTREKKRKKDESCQDTRF